MSDTKPNESASGAGAPMKATPDGESRSASRAISTWAKEKRPPS